MIKNAKTSEYYIVAKRRNQLRKRFLRDGKVQIYIIELLQLFVL